MAQRFAVPALAMLPALLLVGGCTQRPPPIPIPAIGPTEAPLLQAAMEARISLGRNRDGRLVPIGHCRYAREGCERRLAEFSDYIIDAARNHRLDTWLMTAMALKESGLNPFARGSIGELGILQINPNRRDAKDIRFMQDATYRESCREAPGACQREIVEHAAMVLAQALEMCHGDIVGALGAYNSGRCGGNNDYADRVLRERDDLLRAVGLDMQLAAAERTSHPS